MKRENSINNISFSFLKGSSDFLNLVLENITSCVLLLNEKMELQAFNDPLKTIFSNKPDEHIMYQRCGEVLGCAFTVEESKDCGTTSHCKTCELRISALKSYLNNEAIYKKQISRPFYKTNDEKVIKHLQYSTRLFTYEKEKYIMMIIEDITPLVNLKHQVQELESSLPYED